MSKPDKKPPPFRPPIESPRTRALVNLIMRPMLRFARGVQRVEIAGGDLKRLKALKNERVVLTPNHPTNTDPALIMELSRRAGVPFHYLACREAFDHALKTLAPSDMEQMVSTALGELPKAAIAGLPVVELINHHGQLTYIQSLLGDSESHLIIS